MKQRLKKILSVCMISLCLFSLTACGSAKDSDKEIDDSVKEVLITTAEGLTDAIVPLSDEDIENFKKSADSFTAGAVESWDTAREELGELKEKGETTVAYTKDSYTVTVPGTFEKADANFVYMFEEATGAPTSLSVDVQYPMSVTLERAGLNTLMGLGTVFIMLIFLSFVIYLMGKACAGIQKKLEKKDTAVPAPVPAAPAPVVEEVQEADDTELIAVIAAAIAAAEGTSPDGFVVRSVRKINRRKW